MQILAPGGWLSVMGGASKAALGTANPALYRPLKCLIDPEDAHSPQFKFDFLTKFLNELVNETAFESIANR